MAVSLAYLYIALHRPVDDLRPKRMLRKSCGLLHLRAVALAPLLGFEPMLPKLALEWRRVALRIEFLPAFGHDADAYGLLL